MGQPLFSSNTVRFGLVLFGLVETLVFFPFPLWSTTKVNSIMITNHKLTTMTMCEKTHFHNLLKLYYLLIWTEKNCFFFRDQH